MGNTPSTPPALVSVNAGGNEILVPTGTSLYACPPPTPGGYHPPYSYGPHEARGPIYRLVESPYDRSRPRRKRYGRAEADLSIREYQDESDSTNLGELPEPIKMRKGSKTPDIRMADGRKVIPAPYDTESRPSSTSAGYVDVRGSHGHLGVRPGIEEPVFDSNTAQIRPGMHPTMPYLLPHPSVVPLSALPPRYVSREPKPSFPAGVGIPNMNPYAPYPVQASQSTNSPPLSPQSALNRLPPGVQRSAEFAEKTKLHPSRPRDFPSGYVKKNGNTLDNGWGEGTGACACATKCKCRKSESPTGWCEDVADIDGEKVPVNGKLNARWKFKGGMQKRYGGYTELRKNHSSSGTETETSGSKKTKKNKSRKKSKKARNTNNNRLKEATCETDKVTKVAPLAIAGTDFHFDPKYMDKSDLTMLKQMNRLRVGMSVNPYGIGRMSGADATGRTQCTSEPTAKGNRRSSQMQPKAHGVRARVGGDRSMENSEGSGSTSLGNIYVRPRARNSKGRNRHLLQSMGQTGILFRGSPLQPETEPRLSFRRDLSRRAGDILGTCNVRGGRLHSRFESDDSEPILRPVRRVCTKAVGGNEDSEAMTYKLLKHCVGDEDKDAHPRNERPRAGPLGGKDALRNERIDGRQAYAETDDDEDY